MGRSLVPTFRVYCGTPSHERVDSVPHRADRICMKVEELHGRRTDGAISPFMEGGVSGVVSVRWSVAGVPKAPTCLFEPNKGSIAMNQQLIAC
jgi:hypothetical protein